MCFRDDIKSQVGEFDSLKCADIERFHIESSKNEDGPLTLTVVVQYASIYRMRFDLTHVRKLKLPTLSGGPIEFGELLIDELPSDHPEAPGWQWYDDLWGFSCFCENVHAGVL